MYEDYTDKDAVTQQTAGEIQGKVLTAEARKKVRECSRNVRKGA